MKIKNNFEVVKIADDYTLLPAGEQIETFNGLIVLNEVSAFLREKLKKDLSKEELVNLLINEYEVDIDTAKADVDRMVEEMQRVGILDD